jgi:hypothetical protein
MQVIPRYDADVDIEDHQETGFTLVSTRKQESKSRGHEEGKGKMIDGWDKRGEGIMIWKMSPRNRGSTPISPERNDQQNNNQVYVASEDS